MEALYEPVLPRAARVDVERLDLVAGKPVMDFLGDELTSVVAAQVFWRSVLLDSLAKPFEHVAAAPEPGRLVTRGIRGYIRRGS